MKLFKFFFPKVVAHLETLQKERILHTAIIYSTAYRLKEFMNAANMPIDNYVERQVVRDGLQHDYPELTAGDLKAIFDKIYKA
jgi:hypothetical protein